jgi:predicted ATPase/class 3 adenylate cyclase
LSVSLTPSKRDLPTGTVTFLFTDIEHSTLLLQELGPAWVDVLEAHRRIMREAFEANDGCEVGTEGDSFFVSFASAESAAAAAVSAQRDLAAHAWPGFQLRVRMGLHTGEGTLVGDDYVGLDVHRAARIAAAGHGGQIVLSAATATLIGTALPPGALPRELGEYRLKDLPRPEQLFQLDIDGLPQEFPALKSLDLRRNNLPLQMTPFVGRTAEIADAGSRLAESRLVTVIGPGGMGKTRLAIELAANLLEECADGVWMVELAPISDPDLIASSLLTVVGLREEPGRTALHTLTDHLASRQVLLVLDNCEHLVEACAQLASALLRACPKLRVLATSREALGVPGEVAWRIPAMGVPQELPPLDDLMEWPAVALFVDRALSARPAFQVSEKNAGAIVELCRHLDGIPLAIELAAARLNVLSVEQLAGRLNDRFRLLTGGSRAALPRQQTLRATIDWSYELLTEHEKAFLRRASVFAGGFDLEAAEAICGWDPLDPSDVIDLVGALASKSLLVLEEGDDPRYGALETIRQYGAERLREAAEEAEQGKLHREWFLALAEQAEAELRRTDQFAWFARLDRELDNLRSGYGGSLEQGQIEASLRYATALGLYWRVRGRVTEGGEWLGRALQSTEHAGSAFYAKGLAWAAYLGIYLGAYAEAELQAEQSLEIYRQLNDEWGIGFALQVLGAVAYNQDDYERSATFERESLDYLGRAGDPDGQAFCYLYLGNIALQRGEFEEALAVLHEALALLRKVGDKRATAIVLRLMGNVELHQGHYAPAAALLGDSLAIVREAGDKVDLNSGLMALARAVRCEGDYERATGLFEEALQLGRELGHERGMAICSIERGIIARLAGDLPRATELVAEGLSMLAPREKANIALGLQAQAMVRAEQGQPADAIKLLGAANAMRQELGTPLAMFDQVEADRHLLALRDQMPELDFSRFWAEGAALSQLDAVALATAVGPRPTA